MKRDRWNIVLFMLTLFIMGALNLINPDKPRVSEIENRTLKAAPGFSAAALFDGSLFKDYEDYFADTFIFREALVNISTDLKALRGYEPEGGAEIVRSRGNNMAEAQIDPDKAQNSLEKPGRVQGNRPGGMTAWNKTQPMPGNSDPTAKRKGGSSLTDVDNSTSSNKVSRTGEINAPGGGGNGAGYQEGTNAGNDSVGTGKGTGFVDTDIAAGTGGTGSTGDTGSTGGSGGSSGSDGTGGPGGTGGSGGSGSSVGSDGSGNSGSSGCTSGSGSTGSADQAAADGGLEGGMLVLGDAAMEIYHFNEGPSRHYASVLNSFKAKLPDNMSVYSMIVPTRFEFIKNEKFKKLGASQKEAITYINSYLDKSIKTIDVSSVLGAHSDEYIYFRSDHHWTASGAYYAYTEFIKKAGMEPASLDAFTAGKVDGFLGSTYASTLSKRVRKNPDKITYYKPKADHTYYYYTDSAVESDLINLAKAESDNKYRIFLGGDRALGKIETCNKNGRRIMVVKDSFANAFIPFLVPNYEEIYIVDPRMFGSNLVSFAKKHEVQDILFLNYTIATATNAFSDLIRNLTE